MLGWVACLILLCRKLYTSILPAPHRGRGLVMSTKIVIPSFLSFIYSSVTFSYIGRQTKKYHFRVWELLPLFQVAEFLSGGIWKHVENCWQEPDKQQGAMLFPSAVVLAPPTDQILILPRVANCKNGALVVILHIMTVECIVCGSRCPCLLMYVSLLL